LRRCACGHDNAICVISNEKITSYAPFSRLARPFCSPIRSSRTRHRADIGPSPL